MPSQNANINASFFDGNYKEVWRKIIPSGLTEVEAEFIQQVGLLDKGGNLLDLMCGYGRHSIELAGRGINVTAVDNSKEYIDEIKQYAVRNNLAIDPYVADALEFRSGMVFDAVICMGNSFSFFNVTELSQLLKRISSALRMEGVFIINSWMIAEIAFKHFQEKTWSYVDDYKYLLDNKFCFFPSRIESEHTIVAADGTIEIIKGIDYIITLDELSVLCKEAGLKIKYLYSTPKKRPFNLGDSRIYIVIQKTQS
ncbi:MAG TPA: class I SAM-dependent methyltransferase [Flavisolibacter sp.]|jgi:SAM-dependent methyltransferase|nr:class I SAM-dependent methyltransferase [Flavisolibacter sp.]